MHRNTAATLVIADPGVTGGVFATANGVHDFERRHQFARLVITQLDIATGDILEILGKVLDRCGQTHEMGWKRQRNLPANLLCGHGVRTGQTTGDNRGGGNAIGQF